MKAAARSVILLFLMSVLWTPPGTAGASFGRGGGLGAGARAMGMGGAFVSVADDPDASYWNPAGLVRLSDIALSGMYGSLYNDKTRSTWLTLHVPTKDDIHLSLGVSNQFFMELDGPREDDYSAGVAVPLTRDRRFSAGMSLHYLYTDLGVPGGTARGMGTDLGLLGRFPLPGGREVRAGIAMSDLSTSIRFRNGTEQSVPRTIEPGISFSFNPDTLVAFNAPFTEKKGSSIDEGFRFRGGLEHWLFDHRLGFRTGYIGYSTLPGMISLGTSYHGMGWTLDYAFLNHPKDLGNSHRLSAGWRFGHGGEYGHERVRPYRLETLVGDRCILLGWLAPEGVRVEGYWVYFREEGQGEFQRAQQALLKEEQCLLRGARNGIPYRLCVTAVIEGKESARSNALSVTPRPMLEEARRYYDEGVRLFGEDKLSSSLYSVRRAEALDPNNYEIKDLLRKLQEAMQKGLVSPGSEP